MDLIGTVHLDFDGPSRLERALSQLQPKSIGLEAPVGQDIHFLNDAVQSYISKILTIAKQLDAPKDAYEFMSDYFQLKGFEWKIALKYAKKSGCTVFGVDNFTLDANNLLDSANEQQVRAEIETYQRRANGLTNAELRQKYDKNIALIYEHPDILGSRTTLLDVIEVPDRIQREASIAKTVLEKKPDLGILGGWHIFGSDPLVTPAYVRIGEQIQTRRYKLSEF